MDFGKIISCDESDGRYVIRTDKYPNNRRPTPIENVVKGVPVVGGSLRRCNFLPDCRYRDEIDYNSKKWGGYYLSNGFCLDPDEHRLENGQTYHFCTANDRNCICDGKLYVILDEYGR